MSKLIFQNGQWIDPGVESPQYARSYRRHAHEIGDAAWAAGILGFGIGALLVIAQIYIGFLIG